MRNWIRSLHFGLLLAASFLWCSTWCGSLAQAAEVSGQQSGRWTLAGSPYVVTGDVVVPTGATLTIEPGVVVKFAGYYAIKVNGVLTAIGKPINRIVFTSVYDAEFGFYSTLNANSPTEKDWAGIEFVSHNNATASRLEYCVLRYSANPLQSAQAAPALQKLVLLDCAGKIANLNGKLVPIQAGIETDYLRPTEETATGSGAEEIGLSEEEFSFGEVTVVTVSKREQKVADAPATVYVVTDDMIKDRGYANLEDLLDDIPGVEIQRKSVAEFSNYITFRGIAGNEKFVVLQDGIRISAIDGTPHVVGVNYALAHAKRVEVILGPASALYGVDAFSGIVNIITKSGDELNGAGLVGSFGQFQTTDNSFAWGKQIDQLSLAVAGNFYHSDEPNLADIYKDEFRWYNEQYKTTGNVRLSPFLPDIIVKAPLVPYATPTNSHNLNAKLNFYDFEIAYTRNYEVHNNSVFGKPEFNIYGKEARYGTRLEAAYARHNFTSFNEKWGVQSTLSRGAFSLDPDSKFLNTFSSYNPAYKYASSKSVKLEEQLSYFPSAATSLIGGFSFEDISALPKSGDLPKKFDDNESTDFQGLYYIGTNITDKNGRRLTIAQNFFNLEYQNLGSYFQLQSRLGKGVEMTMGGRYDYNTRYGSSFNPRLGLVLSPSSQTKLKLLYGEAFLAPSPYKAYQHYGAFIPNTDSTGAVTGLFGPFWHLPNPELQPEKLRTYEGSFSFYLASNVALSLDGYYTKISDLIVTGGEPNQVFEGVPVGFAEFPINKGTSTAKGGTIKLEARGKIFTPYAAYSYSTGDIDGEVLPFSAKHSIKAGCDIKQNRLSISPRLIYRSKSHHPLLEDAQGRRLSNKPFALINLFARYAFTPAAGALQASSFVRINNLLNTRYYNISLAGEEGFAATPQDPRRLVGGMTFDF